MALKDILQSQLLTRQLTEKGGATLPQPVTTLPHQAPDTHFALKIYLH